MVRKVPANMAKLRQPLLVPSPGWSKGNKYEIQEQRKNTMFLNKYLGFFANCLLQLLPSHHFLHFKVGIFNANAAEQPSRASGVFQGMAGVRAPSALLGPATGLAPEESSAQLEGWREGKML